MSDTVEFPDPCPCDTLGEVVDTLIATVEAEKYPGTDMRLVLAVLTEWVDSKYPVEAA